MNLSQDGFHGWDNCGFFGNSNVNVRKKFADLTKKICENSQNWWGGALETPYQLEIQEAGGKAIGDGVGGVAEILYQHVGDGVGAVDEVEHFQGGPDILEVAEGAVAAAVAFFAVQQQGAKAYVDANIGVDGEGVAVAQVAGYVEWQVASIQEIQVGLEVLVGGQVVLEEDAEVKQPVGWAPYPAHLCLCAVEWASQ